MEAASREAMYTDAPSPMRVAAQARPSPLLAAVTNARRPPSPRSIAYPVVFTYQSVTYWNRS